MLSYLWNLILYKPLINALAFLISVVPGGNVGLAVIILTILVKLVLFPVAQKALRNQVAMNIMAPELEKIKKSGVSKEEQARLTFELYKKHKTNPFAGCLIQIPMIFVFIALFNAFREGVNFDSNLLYSFVHLPENVNMSFLYFFDMSQKSWILGALAGISQYVQVKFMPKPNTPELKPGEEMSFGDNLNKSMSMNMQYFLPVMIFFFASNFSGAVALYWIISNIFTIGQQIYVNKTEEKELDAEVRVLKA